MGSLSSFCYWQRFSGCCLHSGPAASWVVFRINSLSCAGGCDGSLWILRFPCRGWIEEIVAREPWLWCVLASLWWILMSYRRDALWCWLKCWCKRRIVSTKTSGVITVSICWMLTICLSMTFNLSKLTRSCHAKSSNLPVQCRLLWCLLLLLSKCCCWQKMMVYWFEWSIKKRKTLVPWVPNGWQEASLFVWAKADVPL